MKNPLSSFAPVAPVKEEKIHHSKTHLHPNKQYNEKKEKLSLYNENQSWQEKKKTPTKTNSSGWSINFAHF